MSIGTVRPSKIGLLPCFIIIILWLVIPPPLIPSSPALDPQTRQAALRARHASVTLRRSRAMVMQQQMDAGYGTLRESEQVLVGKAKVSTPNKPRVLIVSAVAPKPCQSANGDNILMLATKNKQDYARMHNYDFYLATHLTRSDIGGAWNKVALMAELLAKNAISKQYEWLVWMDYDAIVYDIKFSIPWEKYEGRNFVLWGQTTELFEKGDAHMGLNTGVFYIRQSNWSAKLFASVSEYGRNNGKLYEEEMKSALGKYDWALFDQNGFAHNLRLPDVHGKENLFLEQDYTINGYWKDFPPSTLAAKKPFVKHYMGCQFCSGINKDSAEVCKKDFSESWRMANDGVNNHLLVS